MNSIRTLLAICALAAPAALVACGDDEAADEDPRAVLEQTFNNDTSVTSGNLTLSASISAEGEEGGSFEGSLSGPFQGDPDNEAALPQLDWTASASGEGAGESIDFEGGVVVTEDNAFIEYDGEAYEVGADSFAQVKKGIESQAGAAEGESDAAASFAAGCKQALRQAGAKNTSGCEIDFATWLTNLTNEGTEDVGGTESIHISGDADVQQLLTDIGELAAAIPQARAQGFNPSQLGLLSGVVSDASIDVYSSVDEHLLTKLEASVTVDPSALAGDGVEIPVETVEVDFSVEISDINEEQTIEAPSDAQPIDELLGEIPFDISRIPGAPKAGKGKGAKGAAAPNAADAEAYFECIQKATEAGDAKAVEACAEELGG